ncbi:MAG: hypothetical protein UU77_C0003G0054 [candidate division WWE3 bacterium GW2011_GWC1_41_7]|uniref:Uncharacterized protein n=1 Tax=candidate division WWE3 bacterium GW2011_GWC1_41_7 TaxID=1619119 RepID=A0A0G0ZH95_UNCKA|nr:MAG: hypothetical protein UU77_C0003G0054 [candidate division WWE3 bacterium GW2011_GWC1_41_7]
MATALFVDSFSRNVEVSTVSITEVPGKGLVMRFGAKVGNLWPRLEHPGADADCGESGNALDGTQELEDLQDTHRGVGSARKHGDI